MLKAQQRLAEEIKQADMVLEVRDARLPLRSANPKLAETAGMRPRLIVLNKASLADPRAQPAWAANFVSAGVPHLFVDADTRQGIAALKQRVAELTEAAQTKLRARGIRPPPPRLAVVGMPNVGKSTLINRLAGRHRAKTAPMPGVTRHLVWIAVQDEFLLLDSPGIMLPRIDSAADALALTWIGAIKDAVLGAQQVALALLEHLKTHTVQVPGHSWWPAAWKELAADRLLERIGSERGFLAAGGAVDTSKAAQFVLDQYRSGELGRVTFDVPAEGLASSAP